MEDFELMENIRVELEFDRTNFLEDECSFDKLFDFLDEMGFEVVLKDDFSNERVKYEIRKKEEFTGMVRYI